MAQRLANTETALLELRAELLQPSRRELGQRGVGGQQVVGDDLSHASGKRRGIN